MLALLAMLASGVAAADEYATWGAGRPQDAVPALHARAVASDRWDAWLDCGLAAAAAGRRGPAVAWALAAHQRAPERPEPRRALAALGAPLPIGWCQRLGVSAWPGTGWRGPLLLALAGAALGWSLLGRGGRRRAAGFAALLLAVAAPGILAVAVDRRPVLVAVASDTQLLDSAGEPLRAIAAGTILVREPRPPWNGRLLVRLGDGTVGYVPGIDTDPRP